MADYDETPQPVQPTDNLIQQEQVREAEPALDNEPLTLGNKIGRCSLSALLGAVIGVGIAEVVANSLIEISLTPVFSIIFGIAFILLGGVLTWRIWTSIPELPRRILMLVLAAVVVASGIACFFLERDWYKGWTPAGKVPMYALLGVSLSFALTFSITEILNLGLCDRCCGTNFSENPLFGAPRQLALVFGGSMVLGAIDAIMFGAMDVEDDKSDHPKLRLSLLYSLIIGVVIGAILGFFNEWMRLHPVGADAEYRPVRPDSAGANPKATPAPTGYEDI